MMTKRILTIIHLLLIGTAVYLGVGAYQTGMSASRDLKSLPRGHRQSVASQKIEKIPPYSYFAPITDRDLFKTGKRVASTPVSSPIEKLKQTSLNIKLWGTVTGNDGGAVAVIEDPKAKEQNLYKEGDTIQNAVVKKIFREKIVLSVAGNNEILEMEQLKAAGRGPVRGGAPRPATPRASVSRSLPPQNITLKRAQLLESLKTPEDLAKQARFRPHFKDGKQDGLMLTGIKPKSIFRRMGLRNGDIIMGIDETDIRSAEDALGFYQNLQSSSTATLQIKRRGRSRTINYRIK